jgi:ribbon-helix-helix CopG family protein
VATNLRLRPRAEAALKERAAATGRSQQELMRDALDLYLGLVDAPPDRRPRSREELYAAGLLIPARGPLRRVDVPLDTGGLTSIEMLNRDDRF